MRRYLVKTNFLQESVKNDAAALNVNAAAGLPAAGLP